MYFHLSVFLLFTQMAKTIHNNETASYALCLCMIPSSILILLKYYFPTIKKNMCGCSDEVNTIVCSSAKQEQKISVLFGISKKTLRTLNLLANILYRYNL